jgi:hypothetical protein
LGAKSPIIFSAAEGSLFMLFTPVIGVCFSHRIEQYKGTTVSGLSEKSFRKCRRLTWTDLHVLLVSIF